MTYQYDNYNFHYVVESGVCYLCMSDELNKHRIPYAFLQDMKDRFVAQYGRDDPLQAIAFSYNEEFAKVIQERMEFYNSDEADKTIDNIGAVKSQLGHCEAAAGIAGFIKLVMALGRGWIPPNLHFEQPNPLLELPEDPAHWCVDFPVGATRWPQATTRVGGRR